MKYTLDTDFSTLRGAETERWMEGFPEMTKSAFDGRDNRTKLLAHLLILEPYVHTLRLALAEQDEQPSKVLERGMELLWGYLEGKAGLADFEDFANNLFSATIHYNTGEELTEAQREFYEEHLQALEGNGLEWSVLGWISDLLITLTASEGGRLDFPLDAESQLPAYRQIFFTDVEELLNGLADFCIDALDIPMASRRAKDYISAINQAYETPLFRQVVAQVLQGMRTALTAQPEQYEALRQEYQDYVLVPEEYLEEFSGFF